MKTTKSFLIISFVSLLFALLFTQSCSDNSIPVNQTIKNAQGGDELCQTCWLVIYAYIGEDPVKDANVEVDYLGEPYFWGVTDENGICSFYTEGLGLPGSPPDWFVSVNYNNYTIRGELYFPWNGHSYEYVEVECHYGE